MIRRAIRMSGVCLVVLATLGLAACDTGPVVLEGTLTHAETGARWRTSRCGCIRPPRRRWWPRARTGEDGSYRVRAGLLAGVPIGCGSRPITGGRTAIRGARPPMWRWRRASRRGSTRRWCRRWRRCGGRRTAVAVLRRTCGSTCSMLTPGRWWPPRSASTGSGRPGLHRLHELELPAGDIYTFRASGRPFGWTTAWFWRAGGPAGGFGVELSPGEQEVSLSLWSEVEFAGRVVDVAGSPIAGARVLAVPSRDPVPPKPDEATTGADGTFRLGGLPWSYYKLLVINPTAPGPLPAWSMATPPLQRNFRQQPTMGSHSRRGHHARRPLSERAIAPAR